MDEQNLGEIITRELEKLRGVLVTYPRQDVYCSMKDPIQLQVHCDGQVFNIHIERE